MFKTILDSHDLKKLYGQGISIEIKYQTDSETIIQITGAKTKEIIFLEKIFLLETLNYFTPLKQLLRQTSFLITFVS